MGQANKRGSFEVRFAKAKELQKIENEKRRQEMLEAEKKMTPRERKKQLEKAQAMVMLFGAMTPESRDYITRSIQ